MRGYYVTPNNRVERVLLTLHTRGPGPEVLEHNFW